MNQLLLRKDRVIIMDVRIERDSLGEKEVPADRYYGIQTVRAKENFPITGYSTNQSLIRAFGYIKKAAAIANCELGLLDPKKAKAIIAACDEIIAGKWDDEFIVDPIQGGAGTSLNMNVNEVIANRAIELLGGLKGDYRIVSPNTHVNMSQSTNDTFPTALNMACLDVSKDLITELEALVTSLKKKEIEFDDVVKMGRTHLQDAVPIRLGQEFSAYYSVIRRDLGRVRNALENLYSISIGATSIGTGLNALPEYTEKVVRYLSEYTGMPFASAENLVDATQNTDSYTELSSVLKITAINLSKIASDLRLMNSGPKTGFNEINLPARQAGSSIMPGKVNPVICEVMNQISFQVSGNDHTIALASEHGQLEINVMKPVIAFNLLQSITILTNGIKVFRKYAIDGITANIEQCRRLVENSIGIITAVSPYIGYEKASQIAKKALKTNQSIREICLEEGVLSEEQLDKILDVKKMTNPGIIGNKTEVLV